jgi:CheY-like chemotaxis protein
MHDWFDERFSEAGARSFHFSLMRLLMAGVIWAVLGLGVGWPTAGFWVVAAVGVEWPLREVTRPLARGLMLSQAEGVLCMAVYAVAIAVWSAAGAILWSSNHVACEIAGLAFFAAHLLYLGTHHGRSAAALIPALPALAAPALAPLIMPHFQGVDQILIEAGMLAVVAQAAVGIGVNFFDSRRLTRADAEVVAPRNEAQMARRAKSAQAPPAEAPRATPEPVSGRPLRVLAAEDNSINQLVLRTLLAQVGVEPTVVGDGQAALDAWSREPWDLILMDMQMPVMDGPTAARAIRTAEARTGRAYTPIVALTANAMPHGTCDYAEAGMDGHVAKPIEAASLFAALEIARGQGRRDAGEAGATAAA